MKLSEAIRKGCQAIPDQAVGDYFGEKQTNPPQETTLVLTACALGAAAYGTFGVRCFINQSMKNFDDILHKEYEVLSQESIQCPADEKCDFHERLCFKEKHSLYGLIVHLNDDHTWTRERVADLVERAYESAEETAQDGVANHAAN